MLTVFTAAYEGKLYIVQQLIEKDASAATSRDDDQRTPLHWAASGGHANIVNYLLTLHVPIDALDEVKSDLRGWPPITKTCHITTHLPTYVYGTLVLVWLVSSYDCR